MFLKKKFITCMDGWLSPYNLQIVFSQYFWCHDLANLRALESRTAWKSAI